MTVNTKQYDCYLVWDRYCSPDVFGGGELFSRDLEAPAREDRRLGAGELIFLLRVVRTGGAGFIHIPLFIDRPKESLGTDAALLLV